MKESEDWEDIKVNRRKGIRSFLNQLFSSKSQTA